MNPPSLRPIWTPEDFRRAITDMRALHAPERAEAAPVIDIKTRARIA